MLGFGRHQIDIWRFSLAGHVAFEQLVRRRELLLPLPLAGALVAVSLAQLTL